MEKKPLILITNDDGVTAPGIRALVEAARGLGELLVVAPNKPQSGQGHAITLNEPLRLYRVDLFEGVEAWECSGTPVDCVKLAKNMILKDRKPDLCVSGVNHGSNVSINILYSGTMSAAMEASLEGIDSIGFSLLNYRFDADFGPSAHFARLLMAQVLEQGLPQGTKLLNVNIPDLPQENIRGFRVCRQAEAHWKEEYRENTDPYGRKYYWLTGKFVNEDVGEDSDVWALDHGYISVVPSMHDLTAYKALPELAERFRTSPS
jgi:5'-nucleotidase